MYKLNMETTLNWESFEPAFGRWAPLFKPFFLSGGFDPIYKRLKEDSGRGIKIAPLSGNVFRCFQETPPEEVRVILMGLCPYHTFWDSTPVADGLALSCSVTGRLQPSLEMFYTALECEFKECVHLNYIKTPDLTYLARRGVLLLNAALTTPRNKPGAHLPLWDAFMRYFFQETILTNAMPIILLGKEAQKLERHIQPFSWVLKTSHPASAAYSGVGEWDPEGVFKKANKILKDTLDYTLNWFYEEEPPF